MLLSNKAVVGQRASAAARRTLVAVPRPAFRPLPVAPARAAAPASAEASMEEEMAPADPTSMIRNHNLHRDWITHTIAGEHDFAVFFLCSMIFMMLPVMFPGVVLVFAWIHEQFPSLWGSML